MKCFRHQSDRKDKVILGMIIAVLMILFGAATVCGGRSRDGSQLSVNGNTLPELDPMYRVPFQKIRIHAEDGVSGSEEISDYKALQSRLGISLLNSELAGDHPYLCGTIRTDNENFAIIRLSNYILGDTSGYHPLPESQCSEYERYTCKSGKEYVSPVSMEVSIIYSKEQEETGFAKEYLGMYEYYDAYVSEQGYRVILLEETAGSPQSNVTKKKAVFVADGIRYELSGRTSFENMRKIVNSMY